MNRILEFCMAATVIGSAMLGGATSASAQNNQEDPAMRLHEQAREKFQELHRRMQKLQASKQATEPEESQLLQSGSRFIQERKIHDGMKSARKLIADGDFDEALSQMAGVSKDLEGLLEILLNRDSSLEELMERIETLEKFEEQVDDLIEQQKAERSRSRSAEAAREAREDQSDQGCD